MFSIFPFKLGYKVEAKRRTGNIVAFGFTEVGLDVVFKSVNLNYKEKVMAVGRVLELLPQQITSIVT